MSGSAVRDEHGKEVKMRSTISYPAKLRENAKAQKRFLVTVSVNGKFAGDDSIAVQRLADVDMARQVAELATRILNLKLPSTERK
jgi:hypothetical protein